MKILFSIQTSKNGNFRTIFIPKVVRFRASWIHCQETFMIMSSFLKSLPRVSFNVNCSIQKNKLISLFILRKFMRQYLPTCVYVSFKYFDSWLLLATERYLFDSNSVSRALICAAVNAVRGRFFLSDSLSSPVYQQIDELIKIQWVMNL